MVYDIVELALNVRKNPYLYSTCIKISNLLLSDINYYFLFFYFIGFFIWVFNFLSAYLLMVYVIGTLMTV